MNPQSLPAYTMFIGLLSALMAILPADVALAIARLLSGY